MPVLSNNTATRLVVRMGYDELGDIEFGVQTRSIMVTAFEQGLVNLRSLAEIENDDQTPVRNEATTRLHLIDRLFFDSLFWDRQDCSVEHRKQGKYADYLFRTPVANLVVEAKREGTTFELPAGMDQSVIRIDLMRTLAPDVYLAIEQAIQYCGQRGVEFGAVSNGHQLIAFIGSRTDGISPFDGKALVIPDLMNIQEADFRTLWDALSKPGLRERNLLGFLEAGEAVPPPAKPSVRIPNYPGHQHRNNLQVDLQILADVLIEDMWSRPEEEREFLEKCYAESGALSQYALTSRRILESRYEQLSESSFTSPEIASATTRSGVNPDMFADSFASRPILLIGDVGVGKTTFIRNWINVSARDVAEKSIVIYIDLGIKPTLPMELGAFLAEEITRQLRNDHGIDIEERSFLYGVYNVDLQNFDKGLWGGLKDSNPDLYDVKRLEMIDDKKNDTHTHMQECLNHIVMGHKRQVIVFFDNLDQRTDEFQQQAYLLGQSVAQLWPVMVFLTLRPSTYHRSRATGTLSAYHQRAFTISPPRLDRVVEKRLDYAIELLESGRLMGGRVQVTSETLKQFVDILAYSLNRNRDLIEFIDNVCGGNVRLALEFIKTFIGSGHVDTQKILSIYNEGGQYVVPLHEFLRSVMYGDHYWYDPDASEIKNVFDITENDAKEHFLALCLLAYLDRAMQSPGSQGYVDEAELKDHLHSLGFRVAQINAVIRRLLRWKMVDGRLGDNDVGELQVDGAFRVNTIGSYYCRRLVGSFQYLDAVVVDTPWVERMTETVGMNPRSLAERLARAELFREYLDRGWEGLNGLGAAFNWPDLGVEVQNDIDRIRGRDAARVSNDPE